MIMFQKVIFDCANEMLQAFQPEYPNGILHPMEGIPSISAFLISEANIFDVWEDIIMKVMKLGTTCSGILS